VTTEEGCFCETSKSHLVNNLSNSVVNSNNSISVYPNPSTGLVNISNTGDQQIKTIKVMNSIGAIVLNNTVNTQLSEYTLDLNNVSAGVYTVTIETMDGQQFVQKVIIAK